MNHDEIELLAEVRAHCSTGEAKRIRTAAHFSLGDIANHLGVEMSTVSRWERGLRIPRGELALRYGEVLRTLAKAAKKASVAEIRAAAEAKAAREAATRPVVETASRAG